MTPHFQISVALGALVMVAFNAGPIVQAGVNIFLVFCLCFILGYLAEKQRSF